MFARTPSYVSTKCNSHNVTSKERTEPRIGGYVSFSGFVSVNSLLRFRVLLPANERFYLCSPCAVDPLTGYVLLCEVSRVRTNAMLWFDLNYYGGSRVS